MSSPAPLRAWLVACAVALPASGVAQTRSVQELVETIVREGPRAHAIRANVEIVRSDQAARVVFSNPVVSYSREGAGFTEFLRVEQSIPVFGVRAALARAGVAARAAAEAERDGRLWDLRSEATRLVTHWAWARQRAVATAAEAETVARLVEVLRVREREGEGSRFDRLRAEQELAEVRQVARTAVVDATDARSAVVALLPPTVSVTDVQVVGPRAVAPLDVAALWMRASQARAELRALLAAGERTTFEADAARRARRPAPLVSAGVKRAETDAARERGGVFGVDLAVPLFDNGAREAARWSAQLARITAERAVVEQQVRADIARAVDALAARQQALRDVPTDAEGTELVATAEVAYREGEIGIAAFLDALRTAARARLRELDRQLDLRLAEIALERAVGETLWP